MSQISPALVKELREKTNAGMMDCKRALDEASGDMTKAEELLRKKGIASASKKASRVAREGTVASYIHLQGKVGVLVEINCETDFVAKNEVFREFVKDITLHIAASHPLYVSREQVPDTLVQAEREIYAAQVTGKPAKIVDKIVDGKLDKFFGTVCLLEQAFHQEPGSYDPGSRELENLRARREYHYPPLHPLHGRRGHRRVGLFLESGRLPWKLAAFLKVFSRSAAFGGLAFPVCEL